MANDHLYEAAAAGHLLCQRLVIEENLAKNSNQEPLIDEGSYWEEAEGREDSWGQGTEEYNRGF